MTRVDSMTRPSLLYLCITTPIVYYFHKLPGVLFEKFKADIIVLVKNNQKKKQKKPSQNTFICTFKRYTPT